MAMTDNTALYLGQFFRSNDKREGHYGDYQLTRIVGSHAVLIHNSGDWTLVRLDRLHVDGKPRKTGWSLVQ